MGSAMTVPAQRFASGVVGLLMVMAFVAVPAPSARAAVTSANPSDGYGELYPAFTTDDALFAYVTTDTRGGRVCVIPAEGPGGCGSPAMGEPNTVVGIGTMFILLEAPELVVGSYRLRTESPGVGDEWLEGYTSGVFTVGPCTQDCALEIGQKQADEFKASADKAMEGATKTCAVLAAKERAGSVSDVGSGFAVLGSAMGSRTLVGSGAYAFLGGAALGFLDIETSHNEAALKILQMLSCQVAQMQEDIANDPPDPVLHEVQPAVYLHPPTTGSAVIDRLATALDRQAAHGIAARVAYERYQGALLADDLAAQRLQAAAAGTHAQALATELRATAAALRAAADSGDPALTGYPLETAEEVAALAAVGQRVTASGFTADEVRQLRDLGFDDAGIAGVASWFALDFSSLAPGQSLADALREGADVFDAAVGPADAFARSASAVSTTDLASPTAGVEMEIVDADTRRFTATGVSRDGDPVSHTWDFGDGDTATGAVVEHSYATSGTRTVRVTTTETSLWGTSATAELPGVDVVLNRPPSAAEDRITVGMGGTATLNVLANDTDPDDQPVEFVSTAPAAGGTFTCTPTGECTYAADAGLVGVETIRYTITDGLVEATGSVVVTIVDPAGIPVANDLAVTLPRGTQIALTLPASDPVTGPSALAAQIVTPPEGISADVYPGTAVWVTVPADAPLGDHPFTYRVTDGDLTSAIATVTVTVVADNQAPTATDVTLTTPLGTPVAVELAGADADGTPLVYVHGYPAAGSLTGVAPTLVVDPGDAPTGTVLTFDYSASDGIASASGTVTVTVGLPEGGPVVDLGPDLDAVEGLVHLSATARDTEGGELALTWDFGDGESEAGARSDTSHRYDDGSYQVTLTATDSLGRVETDSLTLSVRNSPPSVFPWAGTGPFVAGVPVRFQSFSFDLMDDPLDHRWDFGDGATLATTSSSAEHTFVEPGTYVVHLTADDGAATAGASVVLVVGPATVDAGPDLVVPEGSWVDFSATPFAVEGGPPSVTWEFGDGSPSLTGEQARHRFSGDEPRTVTARATHEGVTVEDAVQVTYTNLPPLVGPDIPLVVEAGSSTHLLAGAADPGGDPMTITWDLGDGSAASGPAVDHAWSVAGDRTIVIRATDDEGATTSATVQVTVAATGTVADEALDSRGRSFHFAFDSNYDKSLAEQYLMITGEANTTGVVSIPGLGFRAEFAITAGRHSTVRLPDDAVPDDVPPESHGSVRVDPHAVVVQARREVTVYGVNRVIASTDAFLAVPDDVAGTSTRAAGFNSSGWGQIDVVALEPETVVTVDPPGGTGTTRTIQPGEVLRVYEGDTMHQVTGSRVSADRPIQVLSGDWCGSIWAQLYCDHLVEAMWPSETWGTHFLTVPLAGRDFDMITVVADRPATEVVLDGALVATLEPGESYTTRVDAAAEVRTSAPAMVVQYSTSIFADAERTDGDPFQMLVPPAEQWLDRYTVASLPGFARNLLNVVIRDGSQGSVRLDGAAVDPAAWSPIGSSGFVGAQLPVGAGEHRVTGERSFALFAYGFDARVSYGYPGGLALGPVTRVARLTLDPASAQRPVGTLDCPVATVVDESGTGLAGIRVDLEISGSQSTALSATTGPDGTAPLCSMGTAPGEATLVAAVGDLEARATRTWTGSLPTGTAPVATSITATTTAGTPLEVRLVATDADLDPLTFTVVEPPTNGTLGAVAGNRVTYTPTAGFTGTDTLRYVAYDGSSTSSAATATITVRPAPAAPARIVITPLSSETEVGDESCSTVSVLDSADEAMPDVTVSITRTGANAGTSEGITAADGALTHCYVGTATGSDTLSAIAGSVGAEATRTWVDVLPEISVQVTASPGELTEPGGAVTFGVAVTSANAEGVRLTALTDSFGGTLAGRGDCQLPQTLSEGEAYSCTFGDDVRGEGGTEHVRVVTATAGDDDGNEDSASASVTIPIDEKVVVPVPVAVIESGPESETTDTSASLAFTAADPAATFECALDDAPLTACTSPVTYSGLSTGAHRFVVRALGAGGTGPAARHEWTVIDPPPNAPPVVAAGETGHAAEGAQIPIRGMAHDPDGDALALVWNVAPATGADPGAECAIATPSTLETTVTCTDDGSYQLTLTASDSHNPPVRSTVALTIANAAPTVQITSPADGSVTRVGSSITLVAAYSDDGSNDTHTYHVDFGDGSAPATGPATGGQVRIAHTFRTVGAYQVDVTVTDDDQGSGSDAVILVAADAKAKVTGGGFVLDPGQSSFGFVVQPDGTGWKGQLALRARGKDRFHGVTVDSLVVVGRTASWSGSGRWNGVEGHTFEARVSDQGAGKKQVRDTFSIRVRAADGSVVFETSGDLRGGNLTVH